MPFKIFKRASFFTTLYNFFKDNSIIFSKENHQSYQTISGYETKLLVVWEIGRHLASIMQYQTKISYISEFERTKFDKKTISSILFYQLDISIGTDVDIVSLPDIITYQGIVLCSSIYHILDKINYKSSIELNGILKKRNSPKLFPTTRNTKLGYNLY